MSVSDLTPVIGCENSPDVIVRKKHVNIKKVRPHVMLILNYDNFIYASSPVTICQGVAKSFKDCSQKITRTIDGRSSRKQTRTSGESAHRRDREKVLIL